MQARHLVLSLVSAVGLMGCASYTFSSNDYKHFAFQWAAAHSCSRDGLMDADTAATGIQIMENRLRTATFDRGLLDQEINKIGKNGFAPEGCRNAAVTILGWQKKVAQQRQDAADGYQAGKAFSDSVQNARPKQTVCNRLGTQVFCSTY